MSDLIARADDGALNLYENPTLINPKMEGAKLFAEYCAKMRRWPEAEQAIDAQIECQKTVVKWWEDNVRAHGKHGVNAGPALTVAEAEKVVAIRQYQVSRFKGNLADGAAYRERLLGRLRREAGVDFLEHTDPATRRPTPHREGPDYWPTPRSLIAAFMNHVIPMLPAVPLWECAAGDGRLANAISEVSEVYSSDLYPQDDSPPRDFLTASSPRSDVIVATNPPYNNSDAFLERGLQMLDAKEIAGLCLLLRHDHLMASGRVAAFNRATCEVHCNWRPLWIDGSEGQPRWSFHWVVWLDGAARRPPIYLSENML